MITGIEIIQERKVSTNAVKNIRFIKEGTFLSAFFIVS